MKTVSERTMLRKYEYQNMNINDAELKDFLKIHDAELEWERPNADAVIFLFEEFKLENNRVDQILDY